MMDIWFDDEFDPGATENESGGGGENDDPPPAGKKEGRIINWEWREGKKGPYLNLAVEITEGPYRSRWVWDILSTSPKAGFRWAQFFKALGWTPEFGAINRGDPDELSRWLDSGRRFEFESFVDSYKKMNSETGRYETRRTAKVKAYFCPAADEEPLSGEPEPKQSREKGMPPPDPGGDDAPFPDDDDEMPF